MTPFIEALHDNNTNMPMLGSFHMYHVHQFNMLAQGTTEVNEYVSILSI